MILDETLWQKGTELLPWYGIGWISYEYSLGHATQQTAVVETDSFIGQVQYSAQIFGSSMGVS